MDNKQYIREGQKVTFSAQLEKGDRRLTSWIVYEGNQCDDNHIVKEEKQIGTEFSHIFEKAGEYTIVSYGKRDEINKSTATQVQVGKPVLEGIECVERANTYFKNNVYIVKKGTKVTFRLKFKDDVLPTSDKLLHLVKVTPIGGTSSGKIIREGKENEYSYNATNRSSYTVIVKFGNRTFEFSMRVVENFEEEVKKFKESISKNSSAEITIIPEKVKFVRPNKSLKLKFNKKNSVLAEDTAIDTSTLIWKLNGKVLNAKGAQIEIPREIIANCKKDNNKVEVFKNSTDKKAVAFCEFSVAKNKVNKFDVSKRPVLAGKKVTFEVKDTKKEDDYMIFKDLDDFENIHWEVIKDEKTIGRGTGFKFDYTFKEGGKFQVKCYIFDEKGEVKEDVNVIQPKIFPETAQWIDKDGATGNILEKAGYYQKIYAFVKHQDLLGEKVIVDVYDDDKASADDWITSNYQLVENKENIYIPFVLTRDHKEKIKDSLSEEGKLFFKVKSVDSQFHIGNSEAELAKHLTIVPDSEIVDTYFCDEGDTVKYDIQELSTSIFLKIYAINMVSRKIRVCVLENVSDTTRQCMNWDSYYRKSLCQKEVAINDKGEAILPIDLTKFTQYNNGTIILSAVMIRSEYKLDGKDYTDYYRINAKIVLIKEPSLPHMEENFSPVKVRRIAIEKIKVQEKKEDDAVVVLTGETTSLGEISRGRGEYYMYKVNIYNGISYETYIKNKDVLEPTDTFELARDAWKIEDKKPRSDKRYGSRNETPPGTYWLSYKPEGYGKKKHRLKVSDNPKLDEIRGVDGVRQAIRIHSFSPHDAEGCLTTGGKKRPEDGSKSLEDQFIDKIPALKKKSIRFIIEPREAIEGMKTEKVISKENPEIRVYVTNKVFKGVENKKNK
ncbi:hypothetical protein C8P65_10554 [Capnocytophaga leadbetteri]|uniref:Uncharacterized protein n=1 Tax=Capnocytophaga leadbetteri TaxID=327575 RepID=A0A2T5XUT1_9FLAO|nr:hypothetical protein [Capnocytophaga leadbetteri]PTX07051.1 hypothetical protein C8P65_10554 [Capnocytophaga leadbetteri]